MYEWFSLCRKDETAVDINPLRISLNRNNITNERINSLQWFTRIVLEHHPAYFGNETRVCEICAKTLHSFSKQCSQSRRELIKITQNSSTKSSHAKSQCVTDLIQKQNYSPRHWKSSSYHCPKYARQVKWNEDDTDLIFDIKVVVHSILAHAKF